MPFSLFRDCGKWSAYECDGGRFVNRAQVEDELRRLQREDLDSALRDLEMARSRVKKYRQRLADDLPIRMKDEGPYGK